MPLLNKQPFAKSKLPPDLEPDEEVFFCEPTKEIFRDYDKFFERMILCNSLLWSCEMTGKSGLTYQEAAESERAAKRSLNSVQKELKRALLLLCSMTRKTSFNELCVDIYTYIKDRYFKGEMVQVKRGSQWIDCTIQSMCVSGDPEATPAVNGHSDQGAGDSQRPSSRLRSEGVPADRVLYQVHHAPTGRQLMVHADALRRDKATFSKERLRVLLKHSSRVDDGGFLVVRAPAARGLGLDSLQFADVFVGAQPVFVPNRALAARAKPTEKPKPAPQPAKPKTEMVFDENDDEPLSAVQLEIRQRWEAERRRLVEQRVMERDQRRHRKKLVAEWLKDWTKPREDLLCEDHRELPVMLPVHTRVPGQLFGGCLQLLEFVNSFGQLLELTDTFPLGLSLPLLERALVDTEVAGTLSDLLQVLLRAVFELQREEDEESGGRSSTAAASAADQLDPLTLTEVLRRHLMATDTSEDSRWRYQQRGGYTETDNPTVQFRLDHPDIMEKLSTETVYDLTPGERLAVLECLMGEILTTVTARDVIEEAEGKLKEVRAQLRTLRFNILAYQKGVAAERVTERREDRQRQQLEQLKASAEAGDTSADVEPPPEPEEPPESAPEPEAERRRRRREEERQLAEFARRESRLLEQLADLSQQFALTPLGRDRAYRRYWLGRALPGLFIEHDDDTVGACLPTATPHNRQLSGAAAGERADVLRGLLSERLLQRAGAPAATAAAAAAAPDHGSPSDKENTPAPAPAPKTYAKRLAALTEQNQPDGSRAPAPAEPDVKARLDELVAGEAPPDRRLLVCTAAGDECPVHSTILPRATWSFCPDLEHLDVLVATLNERGVREAELKAAIAQAGDSLRRGVERCPRNDLTQGTDRRPRRDPASTGSDPNYNFPAGTPAAEIQELLLRDMILECEEKIRFGCLGTIQVFDLSVWRQALVERSYDQQCDKLTWGADGACSADNSVDVSGTSTPVAASAAERPPSAPELSRRLQRRHLVRSLASAILQLEQGIDRRYLQKPLGDPGSALQQWEASLMASCSLSQLFVHFAQLESAVLWSRSALNARCKICRKKSDPDKMLLCDGCDKGFHMFCLTPKMKSIPKGDWFCSTCRPKEKPKSPRKQRRAFHMVDESVDEDEASADEDQPAEAPSPSPPAKRPSRGGEVSPPERPREASPQAAGSVGKRRRGGAAPDDRLDTALLAGLLDEMRRHPGSDLFLRPVKTREAPDYYQIVREPMDISTMQRKLSTGDYTSTAEFVADAGLIFSNCAMYNDSKAQISRDCEKLRRFFEKRSRELGIGPVAKRARRSY
ncbi:bromodomain adjacent to zinc finger domain protein 1A-like [Pollicipes pollicipes]|uniref:bromodomain adjacent to zinc finger domain protein 1A-like n=2 Tax=Pollicipes pollicipes TaxID=41117 RepID=UPI0018855E17|nr:bromodomain adjacent to zinc finger domain protein 1A-like [Pollicipes pollicipes]